MIILLCSKKSVAFGLQTLHQIVYLNYCANEFVNETRFFNCRESRDRRRSDRSDRYRRDSRLDSRKERDYQARDRSYDRYDDRYSDRMSENSQYDDYNGDDGYRRSPRRDEVSIICN